MTYIWGVPSGLGAASVANYCPSRMVGGTSKIYVNQTLILDPQIHPVPVLILNFNFSSSSKPPPCSTSPGSTITVAETPWPPSPPCNSRQPRQLPRGAIQ